MTDPPKSYHDALKKAKTERMFVLDRERGEEENGPFEKVQIAGSTGNVYTVKVRNKVSGSWPPANVRDTC